jgi:hypothetical protein
MLASISTTWYTRIEQGRDVVASPELIGRVADALQLSWAARQHLYELAGHTVRAIHERDAGNVPRDLALSLEAISAAAYVLDPSWTARAWNTAARKLFQGWLGGNDANILRYVFLNPSAKQFIVDWETRAKRLVAEFRADTVEYIQKPIVADLLQQLRSGSDVFAQLWDAQLVLEREGGERSFLLPDGHVVRRSQLTLIRQSDPGFKLVILLET